MKRALKWLPLTAFLAVVIFFIWPYYVRSRRPAHYRFRISKTFSQIAHKKTSTSLRDMTQRSVVVEGPCNGGCYGGVLNQQSPAVFAKVIEKLRGYDGKTTSIIWLYEIKPTTVERRNDTWGDDTVTISGKIMNDKKFHFAVVPTYVVEPFLQWIFVDTK